MLNMVTCSTCDLTYPITEYCHSCYWEISLFWESFFSDFSNFCNDPYLLYIEDLYTHKINVAESFADSMLWEVIAMYGGNVESFLSGQTLQVTDQRLIILIVR